MNRSAKKKILISAAAIFGAALLAAAVYIIATNRTYTISPGSLPLGYVSLDSKDSYIKSFELKDIKYYDALLHYKLDDEDKHFLEERSAENVYSGILNIGEYYSTGGVYYNYGTQINCEPVETTKEYAVIRYFGTGMTDNGTPETVDDYWRYEIGELYDGRPTYSQLLSDYTDRY